MACKCQKCETLYKIDILIEDDLWEKIKPHGKPKGAGLLCPVCIISAVENLTGHAAFILKQLNK